MTPGREGCGERSKKSKGGGFIPLLK